MKNRETTECVVLGALMTGPMHGYDIMKFVDRHLSGIWHISTSQLYALNHRLEERGLVSGSTSQQGNQPPKRTLSILPEGRKRFMRWVVSPTPHVRELRLEFLTKLFFLRHTGIKGGRALLDAQAELLKSLKEKVEQDWGAQEDGFAKVVLGFKRAQFEIILSWLGADAVQFVEAIDSCGPDELPGLEAYPEESAWREKQG